ncbi:unnamed protein product [Brugia timori]|uniref:Transposase n=1 Tax=Brugia timori TaxID=42155 RepID=A0A0R3Q833_9BILA|nr:unnamed protein product [Brugia timori]
MEVHFPMLSPFGFKKLNDKWVLALNRLPQVLLYQKGSSYM